MRDLDETDAEILQLLVADGRRPYSDIADAVDLSAPAVRDRIDRLCEVGVIRRFTVDVDRSKLRAGVPVLATVEVAPGDVDRVRTALAEADGVEHVFVTADARVVVQARVPNGDVGGLLEDRVGLDAVRGFEVDLLTAVEWAPRVADTDFALECAECGNTVTAEGEASRLGGTLYHFCCASCQARFEDRYDELAADAD
ncbi:MAG: AsnC family transcriptional regulator [Halobacteriales archaeon]